VNESQDGTETALEDLLALSISGSVEASNSCRLNRAAGSDAERARSRVASVALASASFSLGTPERSEAGTVGRSEMAAASGISPRDRSIATLAMSPTVTTAMIKAAAASNWTVRRVWSDG
jgi:hypothetical protein